MQIMQSKISKIFITLAIIGAGLFVVTPTVYAASCEDGGSILTLPKWYRGVENTVNENCEIDYENKNFMTIIILNVGDILAQMVGYASFGYILFGGLKYILAAGSAEGVKGAKNTITNAVIGLIISLLAVGVVNFVFNLVK